VAERSKALDWKFSNTLKVFVGSNPTLSANLKNQRGQLFSEASAARSPLKRE
jgi:hypothetical protein